MLPKQHRLQRSDYDLVFKKGCRKRGKNFSLIILPAEDRNKPCKIGVIVTKKVYKKAVDRNKLKRQIRDTINTSILKTLTNGQKIVITAFPPQGLVKYEQLKEELIELFKQI